MGGRERAREREREREQLLLPNLDHWIVLLISSMHVCNKITFGVHLLTKLTTLAIHHWLMVQGKMGLSIAFSTMHREGAGIATSPNTSQFCARLGLQTVVAEVEKLQSAFMYSIDSEDTRVLDQVGTCTYMCQKL